MKFRQIVSLTLMIMFILLLITSLILYVIPEGRVAYWANWSMLGMGKSLWSSLHVNIGFLFVLFSILHTILNWKAIITYLKNKAKSLTLLKGELIVAIIFSAAVCLGTGWRQPPFSWILILKDHIKDHGAQKYGEPPYGHAELSTLKSLTKKQGLNLEQCLQNLKTAGITYTNAEQNLKDIAAANNKSPQQVYIIMCQSDSEHNAESNDSPNLSSAMPAEPPAGTGSRPLGRLCQQFNLDIGQVVSLLKAANITASADMTLKSIGTQNNRHPHDIYHIIYQASQSSDSKP